MTSTRIAAMERDDTDFSHLFSSNTAPTPLQVPAIQNSLDAMVRQLKVLEEEIRKHQGLLSPLRRMPMEVLGEIFHLSITPDALWAVDRGDVLNLTLVCKHWHRAAFAEHRLWNRLHFYIGPNPDPQVWKKMKAWLRRAGDLQKVLEIEDCGSHQILDKESCVCAVADPGFIHLLKEATPLERLSLWIFQSSCLKNMLSLIEPNSANPHHAWDSIRSFALDIARWDEEVGLDFIQLTPITDLTLSPPMNIPPHPTLEIPAIMQERLTSFELKCSGASCGVRLLSALQHCVNLESLTIDMAFMPTFITNVDHPLLMTLPLEGLGLPQLHNLKMVHLTPSTLTQFLFFLVAPRLASIELSFEDFRQPEELRLHNIQNGYLFSGLHVVGNFFQRRQNANTKRTLRSFSLRGVVTTNRLLQQALLAWPALAHVKLENVFFKAEGGLPDAVAMFAYGQDPPPGGGVPRLDLGYLLNLEVFELHGLAVDFPIQDALWAVRGADKLKKVVILYRIPLPFQSPAAIAIGQGLLARNPGMNIYIRPCPSLQ